MNINNNPNLSRTRIDCFTQDALEQIKGTLNGDEVTFPNRGGLGTDVRYLSDFAVEQIKNAVTVNGGGGETKKIVKCWKEIDDAVFEEFQSQIVQNGKTFDIDCNADGYGYYYFTTDENEPQEDNSNVAFRFSVEEPSGSIPPTVYSTQYNTSLNYKTLVNYFRSAKDDGNHLLCPTTIYRFYESERLDVPAELVIKIH